ncbi:MAG: hypothetical protein E2590_12770 [Chryseobacterium sp.]|nr:hypothetical protein [Chryseobacterium sp.]
MNLSNEPTPKSKFKTVLNAAEKAFKTLFERKGYSPEDIDTVPEYNDLIQATSSIFEETISHEVPKEMREYLKNDSLIFSGLKTHAQLTEARSLLTDENGNIRPYYQFEQDVLKLNEKYNVNYLEAEYQFAVSSSQSAANWANLQDNTDRYWLEYRTAGDEKVRASHRPLRGIVLPKNDPFWFSYYPPNGWRCRCVAIEVLARDYKLSDSKKAIKRGEKATTYINKNNKNTLEMFRFNPGIEKKIFPSDNAYTKVVGSEKVKKMTSPKFIPEKLSEYEKKLGISVNKEFFRLLGKETPLLFSNPVEVKGVSGAYFHNKLNLVVIPLDTPRKSSKWKAESTVYHEFGHAIDWHHDLKKRKAVKELMDKHRDSLDLKKINAKLWDFGYFAHERGLHDFKYKVSAAHDTIMSLNVKYGAGHPLEYWKIEGNKEAEFLAHAFENKFAGNEVFKKVMPELYKDSIKLIDEFMKELANQ